LFAGADPAAAQLAEARKGGFTASGASNEILGPETAEGLSRLLDPDKSVEWEILVPETYDPSKPAGLLVYVSPSRSGEPPPRWKAMLAERNLIWIGANDHGNELSIAPRIGAALLAAAKIEQDYKIDPKRKYVAGFSGGGRVASTIAYVFSKAFRGYVFICGINRQKEPPPRLEDMQQNRYVFLSGSRDFNLLETRGAFSDYEELSITSAKLMVVAGMGHDLPSHRHMAEAIDFLDGVGDEEAN
jgi:hypothetical protein